MSVKQYLPQTRKLLIDNQPKHMFPYENEAYVFEERALLLAKENDIVILRETLPDKYIDFIKCDIQFEIVILDTNNNYNDLADIVLNKKNLDFIKNIISKKFTPNNTILQAYIPDEKIDFISNELGIPVYGKKFFFDNFKKNATNQICSSLRFNVINSKYISDLGDLNSDSVLEFINAHNNIVMKLDNGLGGQEIRVINAKNYKTSVKNYGLPALLQEFLNIELEGSIQFFKHLGQWEFYLCKTFQNGFKFYGFEYPCQGIDFNELLSSARIFLKYFVKEYGDDIPSFGIDFIISNKKTYFHDINPRSTAVTYIFSLLHRLYGNQSLNSIQCKYLQIEYNSNESYIELRKKFESYGLIHISKDIIEGYALLYPSMLKFKVLNILLVSKSNKIDEYLKMIYKALDN